MVILHRICLVNITGFSTLQTEYLTTQIKVDSILLQIQLNNQLLTSSNTNIAQIQQQLITLTTEYTNVIALLNQLITLLNNQSALASLSNGLVAWYPFTGNANDSSGNGLNGIVSGAVLSNDRFGNPNSAYSFNGTSSYIKVNHDNKLNAFPISISCWFYFDATTQSSNQEAFVCKYLSASWNGWNLEIDSTRGGSISPWYLLNTNKNVIGYYGNPPFYCGNVGNNRWHNTTLVVDSASGGKLFLDGYLVSSRSWVGSPGATNNTWPMYFGYYQPSGYYNGMLDDIRVYNRVLTPLEIQYLATH